MRILSRSVIVLSLVSLFTDMASEMLYPVTPLYLAGIGFSALGIGVLEGLAEAVAGLSKGYFGWLSDASGRRVPFVRLGYAMSAAAKPLLAVWAAPLWVFFARTLDRLGKGVRTGARDALLSDEATPATKARVFGFHRAMDTAGAVVGPAAALAFLWAFPGQYVLVFLLAAVPGTLAVAATFLLREKRPGPRNEKPGRVGFFSFLGYWKEAPPEYRRLVAGLVAFALVNSSDVFLLLRARDAGLGDKAAIGLYIFYNLVYALAAYPAGAVADRLGPKHTLLAGILLFAGVYAGMSFDGGLIWFGGLFALYGLYAACTESIAKAWLTNQCNPRQTATAVGTYTAFQSLAALVASTWAGLLWVFGSPALLFAASAAGALGIAVYLAAAVPSGTRAD